MPTGPDRALWTYYLIVAACTGPGLLIALLPFYFRYTTLRYRFDEEGVSLSWGILFRRETYLTYRRIQDIHLTRNILQRWLGISTISVQTASGSATPEMSLEGIRNAEALRDFLYARMRGSQASDVPSAETRPTEPADEFLEILRDIRNSLQQLAQSRKAAS